MLHLDRIDNSLAGVVGSLLAVWCSPSNPWNGFLINGYKPAAFPGINACDALDSLVI
jgi:hypothetical protein